MKLFSNQKLLPLLLAFFSFTASAKGPVIISGQLHPWQKRVVLNFLEKNSLKGSSLIHWDQENVDCLKAFKPILHLCFKNQSLVVIQLDKERVRKTLGRVLEYAETKKALHKEGDI